MFETQGETRREEREREMIRRLMEKEKQTTSLSAATKAAFSTGERDEESSRRGVVSGLFRMTDLGGVVSPSST